jgi:lysyl endopeptidase
LSYCNCITLLKKTTYIFILLIAAMPLFAQEPVSWGFDIDTTPEIIELPALSLSVIVAEDAINDLDKSQPWRYGIERALEVDINSHGIWTVLPNGAGSIWTAAIKSPDAINLSINFDDIYIPLGARLQLFNSDRTDMSRVYGASENTPNNKLGSWFVTGDVVWIEYFEPSSVNQISRLNIGSIIHGYRMGKVTQFVDLNRGLNDSGACNYDVNCPIGTDFESYKAIVKKSVALLTLGNGYLCSSSMVNNTAGDKKPFLLTANHCLQNSDPTYWTVRFNWMSPGPICGEEAASVDIQTNFTMSGAILRAQNALSDFALVEMVNPVPSSWDVAFAGWDNSDIEPLFEVGIHHPNGDIMKISRDDDGALKENANGTEVWLIGGVSIGSGDGWEIGTTESGSSGSPLFDDSGRIIGQLYAGQSNCSGVENNNDYDIYGRFGVSWNSGNSSQTRLKEWLDPLDSGQTTTESIQNILSIPDNQITGLLEIYPNPASTIITISNTRYPNLSYGFYNAVGQRLMGGSLSNSENVLHIENCAEGIYFLNLIDGDTNQQITKKIIIDK